MQKLVKLRIKTSGHAKYITTQKLNKLRAENFKELLK